MLASLARRAVPLAGALAVLAACSSPPEVPDQVRLADRYFRDNNAAARQGPPAQEAFFRSTQHPDFRGQTCELGDMTVDLDPALPTLRPDPGFAPSEAGPPRGSTWVVGVEVTTRRGGEVVGQQIGSLHLVVLDGRMYGFAPCPAA